MTNIIFLSKTQLKTGNVAYFFKMTKRNLPFAVPDDADDDEEVKKQQKKPRKKAAPKKVVSAEAAGEESSPRKTKKGERIDPLKSNKDKNATVFRTPEEIEASKELNKVVLEGLKKIGDVINN